jgi:hypothetical protein
MSDRGDIIDRANERAEQILDAEISEIRHRASVIPEGSPGDCDLCGQWSGRLVNGVCAPCRDRHGLV